MCAHLAWSSVSSPVEEHNCVGIFCSVHWHNGAGPDLYTLLLVNSPSLDTQWILIDCYDFLVLQDCFVVRFKSSEVDRHEERSCKYCPHGHLSLALLVGQTKVPDDQLK